MFPISLRLPNPRPTLQRSAALSLLVFALLAGCSDDPTTPLPQVTQDAGVDAAAAEDAAAEDAAAEDVAAEDVAAEEDAGEDIGEDIGEDAAAEDVGEDAAAEDVGEDAAEDIGEDAAAEDVGEDAAPEDVGEDAAEEEDVGEDAAGEDAGEGDTGVTLEEGPPIWPEGGALEVLERGQETLRLGWPGALDLDAIAGYVLRVDDGTRLELDPAAREVTLEGLEPGRIYAVSLVAEDAGGERSAPLGASAATLDDPANIPPDPATLAPPLGMSASPSLAAQVGFLYEGPTAIQQGVEPGAIEERWVSVLRGQVLDRSGAPLAAARVRVLGAPEYGETRTRLDGAYDLVVEGGGTLVVEVTKPGYLEAQRRVTPRYGEVATVEVMRLVGLDPRVTDINLATLEEIVAAEGSVVEDEDGARQGVLLFEPGVQASMELPGGGSVELDTLSVRLTEYTVGPSGPEAMPSTLPPSSLYTYAVELSVDEAVQQGATTVRFSQAVPFYVDNYLELPVGWRVPVAFYDREASAWVPTPDGQVIAILGVVDGLAQVDLDGDGEADPDGALDAIGLDAAEQEVLAQRYAPGHTLWRTLITHLTPYDCNLAPRINNARERARQETTDLPRPDSPVKTEQEDPCKRAGSIIGCQDHTLGQVLPLQGTSQALVYQSNRAPGRLPRFSWPLTGSDASVLPPEERGYFELTLEIQGRREIRRYPFAPNLNADFPLELETDLYGRPRSGRVVARAQVDIVLPTEYGPAAEGSPSFGRPAAEGEGVRREAAAQRFPLRSWTGDLTPYDGRTHGGFGGWTLSDHHVYNRDTGTLFMGDGRTLVVSPSSLTAEHWAGSGEMPFPAEGLDARQSRWNNGPLAFDASGAAVTMVGLNLLTMGLDRIWHAETPGAAYWVEEGAPLATTRYQAYPGANPSGVVLGPNGDRYIWHRNYIIRVDSEGRLHQVLADMVQAGRQASGQTPNYNALPLSPGVDARRVDLGQLNVFGVAVGPEGEVYFSELRSSRIWRIGPDGRAFPFAGNGEYETLVLSPSGLALDAALPSPGILKIGPDGDLYSIVGGGRWIVRMTTSGVMSLVAGDGICGDAGDGGLAREAPVCAADIAVGDDGTVYVATPGGIGEVSAGRVRAILPDNRVETLAAGGPSGPLPTGPVFAGAIGLTSPYYLGLSPDGSLLVTELRRIQFNYVPYAIRLSSPTGSLTDAGLLVIPSPDGGELFVFDEEGRHLRTLDALTLAERRTWDYDAAGQLVGWQEGATGTTGIVERSGGAATAIVVNGARTTLEQGADGWLRAVEAPGARRWSFAYDRGLMTDYTDPMARTRRYTFDAAGYLLSAEDPRGGVRELLQADLDGVEISRFTTPEGRAVEYTREGSGAARTRRIQSNADGSAAVHEQTVDGWGQTIHPDGFIEQVRFGPAPRFGMLSPLAMESQVQTPQGIASWFMRTRTVQTVSPDNVLEITSMEEIVQTPTGSWREVFDRAALSWERTSPAGRVERVMTDAWLRPLEERLAPTLAPTRWTYDPQGRVARVERGDAAWTWSHDPQGRVQARTDAADHTWLYQWDPADRMTGVTLPSGRSYGLTYDPAGNIAGVIMPSGAVHGIGWTALDEPTGYTPPGSDAEQRTYDLDGAERARLTAGGRLIERRLDPMGRLSQRVTPETTLTFSYAPEHPDPAMMTWDGPAPDDTQAFTVEVDGPLLTGVEWSGPAQGRFDYTYATGFLLTEARYNGAPWMTYTYDADALALVMGPVTAQRGGPAGAVDQLATPLIEQRRQHDSQGRITLRSYLVGGAERYSEAFTYGADQLVATRTVRRGADEQRWAYTYDDDGQLTEVSLNDALVERYAYDLNSNRTLRQLGAGAPEVSTYDAQDRLQLQGAVAWTSDAEGHLTGRDAATFTWSADGLLLGAQVGGAAVSYVYDGLERRVARMEGGAVTRYLYGNPADPLQVSVVIDPAGVETRLYYDDLGHLIHLERAGMAYAVVTDGVGSPVLVLDSAGQEVKALAWTAWGEQVSDSAPSFELPLGFSGGLVDPLTGWVRFGMRDYAPETGRFTRRDPLLFRGGQLNLYAYARNEPIGHRDPSGAICIGGSIFAGLGIGAKLCVTPGRISLCAEVGVGIGASLDVDPFGEPSDTGFYAEAEAGLDFYGIASVGASVGSSYTTQGPCFEASAGASVGFDRFTLSGDVGYQVGEGGGGATGGVSIPFSEAIVPHKGLTRRPQGKKQSRVRPGVKAQAKVSAQVCLGND